MLVKETVESHRDMWTLANNMHPENRECKMCGELPEASEEVFEDGVCPHCERVVETD